MPSVFIFIFALLIVILYFEIFFIGFTLSKLYNAVWFRLFGYVCKKEWMLEVEKVCVLYCEIWIALVYIVQYMGGYAQVLEVLDARM